MNICWYVLRIEHTKYRNISFNLKTRKGRRHFKRLTKCIAF